MAIPQSATWRSSWICSCLAALAVIAWPIAAEARRVELYRIDIEAGSLPAAIAELSRETSVSIGTEGTLPLLRTAALHGRLTVEAALEQLLRGSGYVARQVGPTAWRIEHARAAPAPPQPSKAPTLPQAVAATEIVVSATKRGLTLEEAPVATTIVPVEGSSRFDPNHGTQRVAERVEGLAVTGQGPGRNRMFLRGVADSPFGGKSQSTVAVLLDEARLTYVEPDPDIRLVDVERVELLKGPQGSLYGTGALGGTYRIVTRRADPSVLSIASSIGDEFVAAGELGTGGSLVVNLPLVADVSALRVVAYGEQSPGWLNTGDRKDSNGSSVFGVRAGLGFDLGSGWRGDVTGFGQWLQAHDSNYTYSPEAHERPAQLAEPHDNDLLHGSLRLAREGATRIVLSSAYTIHDVDERYDATQGAESFGLANPQVMDDDARYRLWDSEVRASGTWGRLGWLAGLSHVEAWQKSLRLLQAGDGATITVEAVRQKSVESAFFGEASLPLSHAVEFTLGGRLFHAALRENRHTEGEEGSQEVAHTAITPSASLSWHPRKNRLVYVRYGRAARQGGTTVGADGKVENLDEDELTTLEGGWRETIGSFDLDLGVYRSRWRDIQSDVLLPNGLVEAANVGNGSITGAEFSVQASLEGGWEVDGGAMIQSALLTHDMTGLELDDHRLPVVPSWTLRGSVARRLSIGKWETTVSASARYVGPARLSFDPALDRPMGDFLETGLGIEARQNDWTLALEARNVVNSRGDSFVYGNPFRIFSSRQFVRQDPFSLRLSISVAR